ncbi:hypothetical protein [Flavobacterium gawalongense]|uniref:Secreted protein n=1 Tax=Flavobacterium gawalongense TaxID=2594432 RepID=A0A553BHF6_9FLAO|nr:hypothetical protein [Flavobacterium gawalongense]TRX03330.1 hypothetical protein FNW33_03705 [Flavobacterium gawalongense]TRX04067.1 hypothetical protein FNW12_14665 [Flavobacterium gawalongense]TRX07667.1 hypothetical protein FNW11_12540 [Flavobacterium gawalongense]TRX07820.1 hypothetical protein FNW10_13870 [Flavobacterium gawalongense]TRX23587.1 hypothetical protein FNW38_14360 [Flavobacterium gawalongense]
MRKILFLIVVFGMSLSGYAQNEFSSKFKAIPPKNTSPKIKKAIPPKADLPKITAPKVIKKQDVPLDVPKINFVNPDKITKKAENLEVVNYKRNQNLGNFKTGSLTAKVRYRDAAYVDGDKIRVYLNDKVIKYEVVLDGDFKGFEIKLEKGINKIDFEALNEGFAPPNTAEFEVYDDKGSIISSSQWNLGIDFKATLILMKE